MAVVVEAEVIPIHVRVLKKVELEVQVLLLFNTQVLNKQLEEQLPQFPVARHNIYLLVHVLFIQRIPRHQMFMTT